MIQEDMKMEILSRLPLRSLARLRSVSQNWRELIDSDHFRVRFISRSRKSSSSVSWSVVQMHPHKVTLEVVGHYGCETWGLSCSPGSLMKFLMETTIKKLLVLACTDGLVMIYAEAMDGTPMYYVGNPLFQEWIQIPLPPQLSLQQVKSLRNPWDFRDDSGLVTKMSGNYVLSYKIVWLFALGFNEDDTIYSFAIYSSDTGTWGTRNVTCLPTSFLVSNKKSIALNGSLHWLSSDSDCFIAYDFYGAHGGCSIVEFPDTGELQQLSRFRRTITTSEGSIVYFNDFCENENRTLRVWKLVNYIDDGPEAWQLIRKVSLASLITLGIDYFPVVMHPLNSEIIYFWSRRNKMLILFNLRTHLFSLHLETAYYNRCMDGCILSFNGFSEYLQMCHVPGIAFGPNHLLFSQYVLPRWLHRLPRPQPS